MGVISEICCPNCQKRYVAGDSLAGKRVKCRSCGDSFDVPGDPASQGLLAGATAAGSSSDNPLELDTSGFPAEFGSDDFVLAFRPNTLHKFPTALTLERWLPTSLLTITVLWVTYLTFAYERTGVVWADMLRVPLIVGLYMGVIVPIALYALRRAARTMRFDLPPNPVRRMATVCAIPAALGYALWVVTGTFGAALIGWMVGLVLTSPSFWVLIRPKGEEIVPSYAATCGGFVGGAILSALLLFLVALLVNATVDGFHSADQLHANPVGPSFSWTVTPFGKPQDSNSNVATTSPDTNGATTSPAVPEAVATNTPENSIFTAPSATPPTPTPNISDTPATAPAPPPDPLIAAFNDKHLPFAAAVHTGLTLMQGDNLIKPATFSPWCAVVQHDTQRNDSEDVIIACDVRTWTPGLTIHLPHTQPQDGQNIYALSSDGLLLARAVRFPKAAIQIWSMKETRMIRTVDPAFEYADAPRLIGFSGPHTLVVSGTRKTDEVVEVRDALEGTIIRSFWVPPHVHSRNNCVIDPNGKLLAVAARIDRQAQLLIYTLTEEGKPKVLLTNSLDPKWEVDPAAIAFSPDRLVVTTLFERDGNAAFFSWKMGEASCVPLPDRICPGSWPNLTRTARDGCHSLDFISPDMWIMCGSVEVDANSGRLLSKSDLNVTDQWLSDPNTLNIDYNNEACGRHLSSIQLRQTVSAHH